MPSEIKPAHNSIRHGLCSKTVVLPSENPEEFQLLLDTHHQQYQPQTPIEKEMVECMAVARWRIQRMMTIEGTLLSNELVQNKRNLTQDFKKNALDERLAAVYRRLANNGSSLTVLLRYESTLNRTHDRAFKHLLALQAARKAAVPAPETDLKTRLVP